MTPRGKAVRRPALGRRLTYISPLIYKCDNTTITPPPGASRCRHTSNALGRIYGLYVAPRDCTPMLIQSSPRCILWRAACRFPGTVALLVGGRGAAIHPVDLIQCDKGGSCHILKLSCPPSPPPYPPSGTYPGSDTRHFRPVNVGGQPTDVRLWKRRQII